jgi:hypothetical protein
LTVYGSEIWVRQKSREIHFSFIAKTSTFICFATVKQSKDSVF